MPSERFEFPNAHGEKLAALLDRPAGPVTAYALFAHCFTCGKDVLAAKRIAEGLTARGIAVLRFDFTGLGSSEGEFANTTFSSNVADLVAAANHLREVYRAPAILIGHSLGGAAVLAAAQHCPEVRAVATIAAPADPAHVTGLFKAHVPAIEEKGEVEVSLAGRSFRIRKEFLDDVAEQKVHDCLANLRKALLVLHSPTDDLVGIENASAIFSAAKHPKSFVSLSDADHLLGKRADAVYVAEVIAAWSERYLDMVPEPDVMPLDGVLVGETRNGKFEQAVVIGSHRYLADEPTSVGGNGSGAEPLRIPAGGAWRLHVDDHPALCRPEEAAAHPRGDTAQARQDSRHRLRELRDQGRQDRPHRARDHARRRSLAGPARKTA